MPDPHDTAVADKDLAKDKQMSTIVDKALKKRKRRRRGTQKTAYDKLAMLVPSVTKVLQNSSYGAAAGGFKPSVPVDASNGWSSTKTPSSSPTHTKLSKDGGWRGIQKEALGIQGAGAMVGAVPGALIGGGLGAAGGAGYGALFPGEDERGNQRSRLLEAVKTGLLGAGIGGLGGGAVGGVWGHGMGSGMEGLAEMSPEDREALMQIIMSQG